MCPRTALVGLARVLEIVSLHVETGESLLAIFQHVIQLAVAFAN